MDSSNMSFDIEFKKLISPKTDLKLQKISAENLDVDYGIIFPRSVADKMFHLIEEAVEYNEKDLTKIKVFGKWHDIPRQQAAYGDEGVQCKFSGISVPAKPWLPVLEALKTLVEDISGHTYNYVLINRYRNGCDHIGEHRDDEKELDEETPIASLSFGAKRTFVLKHRDVRLKGVAKRYIPLVKLDLEHGSLLLMNFPTNKFWYHSLPARKKVSGIRVNLTFRKLIV